METTLSKPHRRTGWIFIGWIVLSALWIWFAGKDCSTYSIPLQGTVSYSDLINQHNNLIETLRNPFTGFVISVLVAIPLFIRTKRWIYGILWLPLAGCAGLTLLSQLFCDGIYTLVPIEHVNFAGNTYYLTLTDESEGGGEDNFQMLYLHRCQLDGTQCHAQILSTEPLFCMPEHPIVAHLQTDQAHHQLLILSGDTLMIQVNENGQVVWRNHTDTWCQTPQMR